MSEKMRPVIVTCSDTKGAVSQVEGRLREIGFQVESVLQYAGSVVGSWAGPLGSLRSIPGVEAVEESEERFPL